MANAPKTPRARRTEMVNVRLAPDEMARLIQAAAEADLPVATWCRSLVMNGVRAIEETMTRVDANKGRVR